MRITRRSFLSLAGGLGVAWLAAACRGNGQAELVATGPEPTSPPPTPAPAAPTASPPARVAFDPDLHVLVSKQHALPAGYVPPDLQPIPADWLAPGFSGQLRAGALAALKPMMADAWRRDQVDLRVRSAYRSYATQADTFAYWVNLLGEEQARRESAVPGHSEHQLGTVADFADPGNGWELLASFADTPSGRWLEAHAWEYGFALSYPRDREQVTGYIFEPWHFRYIGVDAAADWRRSGLTLIEYLQQLQA